jgi:hypothetical protein
LLTSTLALSIATAAIVSRALTDAYEINKNIIIKRSQKYFKGNKSTYLTTVILLGKETYLIFPPQHSLKLIDTDTGRG